MLIGITGATGGLGRRLVEILVERGFKVRCLVRRESTMLQALPGVELVRGELLDKSSLESFVKDIEVCVHIAAQVTANTKKELYETNVGGTRNLCEAIKKNNSSCRMIYCSSIVVRNLRFYQKPFVSNYTLSKYSAEKIIEKYQRQIQTTIIYPGYILGKYDRALMQYIVDMLQTGLKFLVKGGESNAPIVYVDDLCELFYLSIINKNSIGKKYVSLEKQEKGMHYVFEYVAKALGYNMPEKSYQKVTIRIYLFLNAIMAKVSKVEKNNMSLRALNLLSNHSKYLNNAYTDIGWSHKYSIDEILDLAVEDYVQAQK